MILSILYTKLKINKIDSSLWYKRIKEHLHNPDDFSHNQSAPAHHSRTTGHKIAWDRATILTTTRYKTQLDLTDHTTIKTRNPSLNRTDSAPTCSKFWYPIIPTNHFNDWHWHHSTLHIPSLTSHSSLAEEDWPMPIESSQYFIILFCVNQVFTFCHFIMIQHHNIYWQLRKWLRYDLSQNSSSGSPW